MEVEKIKVQQIPAVLWGPKRDKIMIAAHGSHSSKIDDCMWALAEAAVPMGYQVLSFDFPKHGERVYEPNPCMVQDCVKELKRILEYASERATEIDLFGCSMGAYFSLLAYKNEKIGHALFLSPVTDMERIIHNIMKMCGVTEEEFCRKQVIENPVETLYWDYYCYVKEHPVTTWDCPTFILYGEHDNLCELERVQAFASRFQCSLEIQKGGEHWFHTPEQLIFFRDWVRDKLEEMKSLPSGK